MILSGRKLLQHFGCVKETLIKLMKALLKLSLKLNLVYMSTITPTCKKKKKKKKKPFLKIMACNNPQFRTNLFNSHISFVPPLPRNCINNYYYMININSLKITRLTQWERWRSSDRHQAGHVCILTPGIYINYHALHG